jgi:hypothetical protein
VPPQREAYNHFLSNYSYKFDYILYVDIDEFLILHDIDVKAFLREAERVDPLVAGIAIPWLMFGSGSQDTFSRELVVSRFTNCEANPGPSVKTFLKPARTYGMRTHISDFITGTYLDNELKPAEWAEDMPINLRSSVEGYAVIHHYFTKSREEWIRRRSFGKADRAHFETRNLAMFEKYRDLPSENLRAKRLAPRINREIERTELLVAANDPQEAGVSLLSADGSWLIARVLADTHMALTARILIDGSREVILPCRLKFQDGSVGFCLQHKWLGEKLETIEVSLIGSLKSQIWSREQFPKAKDALANLIQYLPSAEEMIIGFSLRLLRKEHGLELLGNYRLPRLRKYPWFSMFFDAAGASLESPEVSARMIMEISQQYPKAFEDMKNRILVDAHQRVSKLFDV